MKIKILICDDDALIRESLKIILSMEEDLEIVGEADNGLKAVELCAREKIDVALMDVRMPIMNGVEALKEIVKKTEAKVIILSTFDEDEYIKESVKYGASGYILKNNTPESIVNAIKMVYSGSNVIEKKVFDKIKFNVMDASLKFDASSFTHRELEIIKEISEGFSNKEIAQRLFISEGTVKNYISNILDKTGLEHRTQIAIHYLKGNSY